MSESARAWVRRKRIKPGIALPLLRLAMRLDRQGHVVLPWLIHHLVAGHWLCRVIGHSLVRCLPYCFRCEARWDTWAQVRRYGL